jgi:molybdopterin/thiamine biosynthesis adenylyltransferase
MLRIPTLAPLAKHTVAVFGLGSLGAPAAIELARGGLGELRILDRDYVEAGPIVRWPLGLQVVGDGKAEAVAGFIRNHYPYTVVRHWNHHIGVPHSEPPSDGQVFEEMLAGTSLVLDATAEFDIQRLLSRTALERRIPYVAVVAKPGSWGGMVFRQLPGRACWHCLLQAQDDGRVPHPPASSESGPQARGCSDVTFTGTGFDMATLSLDAVRSVVGTLSGPDGGYPVGAWNVAIISFREDDGSVIPPKWDVFQLERDPACAVCGS